MAELWVTHLLANQNGRSKVLGDLENPLIQKAKKMNKNVREEIQKRVPTQISSNYSMAQKTNSFQPKIELSPEHSSSVLHNDSRQFTFAEIVEKKIKKKEKKNKKKSREMLASISNNLIDATEKTGNLMAEYIKNYGDIALIDDTLYKYDENLGCFRACGYNEIAKEMRSALDYGDQLKISSRDYKECVSQLYISEDLVNQDRFFENGPYVNCLNGVVDVTSGELLKHSPRYFFKHCIHANYMPGAECKKFLDYVDYITDGNRDLRKLLRAILGYIFSHYNNAKMAVLLYGIPHTGKSVICKVIEQIIGAPYVAHVDLSFLHKQEYVASLSNKILNVAPDLKNESLKDVGFFKSLVSHDDTISARALYSNPKDIKCECKMLFSSNHLLTFDSSLDMLDIEAVFNRLVYFPFQNRPIKSSQENKHLSDDLCKERDAIFTWAMKGLQDYVESGEQFPKATLSEDIKRKNVAQYCPEKSFFEKHIKEKEGVFESVSAIKAAYEDFCLQHSVKRRGSITTFIEEHEGVQKIKKRIDENGGPSSSGNPIYVYKNIRLRKN